MTYYNQKERTFRESIYLARGFRQKIKKCLLTLHSETIEEPITFSHKYGLGVRLCS